jgi:hypothetical protein
VVDSAAVSAHAHPSFRDDARLVAWWLLVGIVAGAVVGGLIGGVGGRFVMLALRLTSDVPGLTTDDGFTVGRFTLSGSLQLYFAMAQVGAVNAVAYVAARPFLPDRGKTVLWALVGAAVTGGLVVHREGADFAFLEPGWLAVASFVALPGVGALVIAWSVERAARLEPWRCSRWLALLLVPALPAVIGVALIAVVPAVLVVALGRVQQLRRLPSVRWARLAAFGALVLMISLGALDLGRDAAAIV